MGALVGGNYGENVKSLGYSYDPSPVFGNVRAQVNKGPYGGVQGFPGWYTGEHPLTSILDYFTWSQFNQQERRGLVSAVHAGEFSGEKYMKQIVGGIQDTYNFLQKYKTSENSSAGTFNAVIPISDIQLMQINWQSPGVARSVLPVSAQTSSAVATQSSRINNQSTSSNRTIGFLRPNDTLILTGIKTSPQDWGLLSESIFGGENILSSHRTQWLNVLSRYGLYSPSTGEQITNQGHKQAAQREIATARDIAQRRQQYRKWVEGGADRRAARAGASGGRGAGAVGGAGGASGTDTTLYLNRPSLLGF